MKRIVLISGGIIVSLFLGAAFVFASKPLPADEPTTDVITYSRTIVDGSSMSPTIDNGARVKILRTTKASVGDIVSIRCEIKCVYPEWAAEKGHTEFVKRLIEIDDNNCWYVLGDNRENSWDSSEYGWICPQDRYYFGKVIEVNGKPVE